jgi:hypothetical protein
LEFKHVFQRAVEPIRPEVVAACGVDQLAGDAQPVVPAENYIRQY